MEKQEQCGLQTVVLKQGWHIVQLLLHFTSTLAEVVLTIQLLVTNYNNLASFKLQAPASQVLAFAYSADAFIEMNCVEGSSSKIGISGELYYCSKHSRDDVRMLVVFISQEAR